MASSIIVGTAFDAKDVVFGPMDKTKKGPFVRCLAFRIAQPRDLTIHP